jgi:hypothetical protein
VFGGLAVLSLVAVGLGSIPASAGHGLASLAGSNFEIDNDANLKVDHPAPPSLDWANVNEIRATDVATGQTDDSYKGGVKEDTVCPDETTGSIPNNKSDLLTFSVHEEAGTGGHPGFLNLAWSRVTDPSGTTLMDFEFNQSSTGCDVGPNVVRTEGDLLVEYAIDQGGARADISARTWTGTAWSAPADLDVPSPTCGNAPCAAGTINSTPIPAADSDGIITSGSMASRTFGEAQLDLRLIFQEDACVSFGTAMLKSRSSDAFTSQLKDFISPVGIDLTNCGKVIIRKQTDPDGSTALFNYTKTFDTDPATGNTFDLTDDESETFTGVLFGTGYTVAEDLLNLPPGWDFDSVDCNVAAHPSVGVIPDINGAVVTFAIDDEDDVLDCTYTNKARGTIIVEKITDDGFGAFEFTSGTLTPSPFTLTTTAAGDVGKDSETFTDLAPGTYDVAETVPAGWNLASEACVDTVGTNSTPGSIDLAAGETVTCTFHDEREKGAVLIVKTRKHAASGSGDFAHPGVTFTVTGGELPAAGVTVVTNDAGEACVENLVVSSLVGDYTVTETVPAGYEADGDTAKTVSVTDESTCGDESEALVSFRNTPLTNVTVSVDSQIDGGTASTIVCTDTDANQSSGSTGANGDGSLTVNNLLPTDPTVTLTCEITVDP